MKNHVFVKLFVVIATFQTVLATGNTTFYWPFNDTTVSGTLKNNSCTPLSSGLTVQGGSLHTIEGPNTTITDPALYFGSSNWVNLGDFRDTCISNPALCPNGMTVTFWLYINTTTSGNREIIMTGRLDSSRGMQVFIESTHTNIVICDGTKRYPIDIGLPVGWTHVAAVYNPSGSTAQDQFYAYVNGTEKHTARYETSCIYNDPETSLIIGHDQTSGGPSGRGFALAHLGFYLNGVLSLVEVQAQANSPGSGIELNCPAPTTAPTATGTATGTATSAGGGGNATTSPSGSSGQSGGGGIKVKLPVVLILLSCALFVLVLTVIFILIACCVLVPKFEGKGYKVL